jgi:signal transduction histidine kinase
MGRGTVCSPDRGLDISGGKRIPDRRGDRIAVGSAPGEGSTFVFTLPAA